MCLHTYLLFSYLHSEITERFDSLVAEVDKSIWVMTSSMESGNVSKDRLHEKFQLLESVYMAGFVSLEAHTQHSRQEMNELMKRCQISFDEQKQHELAPDQSMVNHFIFDCEANEALGKIKDQILLLN